MANQIPVKVKGTTVVGDKTLVSLGEFNTGDVVALEHGGTGATTAYDAFTTLLNTIDPSGFVMVSNFNTAFSWAPFVYDSSIPNTVHFNSNFTPVFYLYDTIAGPIGDNNSVFTFQGYNVTGNDSPGQSIQLIAGNAYDFNGGNGGNIWIQAGVSANTEADNGAITLVANGGSGLNSRINLLSNTVNINDALAISTPTPGSVGLFISYGTLFDIGFDAAGTGVHDLYVDNNIKLRTLTASSLVKTDSNKKLVSAIAGTDYEVGLGSGTTSQYLRGDKSWQTLDKTAVGLGNVDNTSDSNKSVSSAATLTTARTINGVSFNGSANITVYDSTKEPSFASGTTADYFRGDKTWQTLNSSAIGLGNVENTALSTWAGTTNITRAGALQVDSLKVNVASLNTNNKVTIKTGGNTSSTNGVEILDSAGTTKFTFRDDGLFLTSTVSAGSVFANFGSTKLTSTQVGNTDAQTTYSVGGFNAATSLLFYAGNAEVARFNTAGQFGIGKTPSAAKLDVQFSTNGFDGIKVKNTNTLSSAASSVIAEGDSSRSIVIANFGSGKTGTYLGETAANLSVMYSNNSPLAIGTADNFKMTFAIAASTKMTLDTNGNFGIGATPSGNAKLEVNGTIIGDRNITLVSTNTTLTSANYTVLVDCTSGNVTITLPTSATGKVFVVKRIDATANTLTIVGTGGVYFDYSGNTSVIITSRSSATLHCYSTNWYLI